MVNTEAETRRPATPSLSVTAPLGTLVSLLPKQNVLVVGAEEPVAAVCRQLHERGLWSCLVRAADGALHFFELTDLCVRLLDALHTDSLVARVVKVLGGCAVRDVANKEPVRPVAASTPLAEVLERLAAGRHERVVVAGPGGEVQRVFACSDLLELLLRYAHGSFRALQEPARQVLSVDMEGEPTETADPGTPVLQCFQTLRERLLAGLAVVDGSEPGQSFLERALGTVTMVDVQFFFLRPAEEAARWASCSAREFVALEMRELLSPRAGAGASRYPFIHADAEQSLEALVSKLLSSRAHCIALCSPSRGLLRGMVRAHRVVRAVRSWLDGVIFDCGEASAGLPSPRSWPSPIAGPCDRAQPPPTAGSQNSGLVRRVSWKDRNGTASLASVLEFEAEGTPKTLGTSMVLALEDARGGAGADEEEEVARLPRLPRSQMPQLLLPPPASTGGRGAGTDQQLPHHHHILSVLALEDPALQEPLEPCDAGLWRQLSPGPEPAEAAACGSHPPRFAGQCNEQLQLVLYQKRELVLYDRHRNRAFARRLTEEQADLITCNQQSFCPLCRQRLNPSWAFVVEGYFEMLSAMAPPAPASSSAFASDEEAAAACGLHSIPAGLLNSGYYHRFFVEDRKLGSGSFGAVYLCRHVMDEIELGVFAVKKLALGDDTKRLRQTMREVKALERLRHMNIIDYKHSWLEVSRHSEFCPYVPFLFILMEYCNAGSLESLIWPEGFVRGAPDNAARYNVLAEELIWLLFLDVCRGLRHLHSRSILHRDLKPSNILLHVDDVPGEAACASAQAKVPRAILSDFGTCEILGEGTSVGGGHVHGAYAIEFSAPERLSGEESDEPADMWSAGLVLYAMAYGDLPYHSEDPETCRERVMAHSVLSDLPDWRDSALRGLISALTARAPVARPTAEEAERVSASACSRRPQSPGASSNGKASPQLLPPAGAPLTLLDMESSPSRSQAPSIARITSASSISSATSDLGEDVWTTSGQGLT